MSTRNYLIILCIVMGVLSVAGQAGATETYAIIKSKSLRQIDEVITGFQNSFPEANPAILDLEGNADSRKVKQFIELHQPDVIICLGLLAAKTTIRVEQERPIIFSMVINYKRYPELRQENVTGISMEIPPMSLFTQFRLISPQIHSIGVPYHPEVSSEIVEEAQAHASQMGIQLIKIAINDPNTLTAKLKKQQKRIDGLWMLADTKLYNRNTTAIQDLIRFSQQTQKPILAFSEAFLKPGAFFSISIDYHSLGSQLALVAKRIGEDHVQPAQISIAPPIGTYTVINRNVAQQLYENQLDESIFDDVDKIFPEDLSDHK